MIVSVTVLRKKLRKKLNALRNTSGNRPNLKFVARCPECPKEQSGYSSACDCFVEPGTRTKRCANGHQFAIA